MISFPTSEKMNDIYYLVKTEVTGHEDDDPPPLTIDNFDHDNDDDMEPPLMIGITLLYNLVIGIYGSTS